LFDLGGARHHRIWMEWLGVILVPAFLVCLYLLPAFVAGKRKHKNGAAILVLNLLLGWTVLGWIIALVWACTSNVGSTNNSA
jgi:RsiW-degrading membrane proteinase PrsW (M82 family)